MFDFNQVWAKDSGFIGLSPCIILLNTGKEQSYKLNSLYSSEPSITITLAKLLEAIVQGQPSFSSKAGLWSVIDLPSVPLLILVPHPLSAMEGVVYGSWIVTDIVLLLYVTEMVQRRTLPKITLHFSGPTVSAMPLLLLSQWKNKTRSDIRIKQLKWWKQTRQQLLQMASSSSSACHRPAFAGELYYA